VDVLGFFTTVWVSVHLVVRMLTAWKALSHANAKGKGINSASWVGNQVFRLAEEEKKCVLCKRSPKTFWEIQNHKFHADD
jgi:hypothetical protein